MNEKTWQIITISILATSSILISMISFFHLFTMFDIGYSIALSWAAAGAFELLSLGTMVSIRQLSKLQKGTRIAIWISIVTLVLLQIFGNIFSVYIAVDATQAAQVANLLGMTNGIAVVRLIAIILGSILPITSVFFIKILASYLDIIDRKNEKERVI